MDDPYSEVAYAVLLGLIVIQSKTDMATSKEGLPHSAPFEKQITMLLTLWSC